jgi:TonB family protein
MSASPIIRKDECQIRERRICPREQLKCVVLVYFGENSWGRLIDLSKSGMCFEFAQPLSDRERINFKFEAMGPLPSSFGGEIITDSFEAAGDIRWTRDFERTAGVQFVDLAEGDREQIRKWLSFDDSADSGPSRNKTEPEAPGLQLEPFEPSAAPSEMLPEVTRDEMQLEAERGGPSGAEPCLDSLMDPVSPLVAETMEAPSFQDDSQAITEEENKNDEPPSSSLRMSRIQLLAVTLVLAVMAVIAGIRMILPHLAHGVHVVEPISGPSVAKSERPASQYDSTVGSPQPFLVQVVDSYNRRWLLWFDSDNPKNAVTQTAYRPAPPSSTALSKGASQPKQPAASTKPETPHKFTLLAPKPSRSEAPNLAANSPPLTAPVVRDELQPPLEAPIADILSSPAIPSPISGSVPAGGQIQVARLLKSVPPVYPQFARLNHISGDVTLDALIDAAGNVTELKVISGPPILRQAAIDAVRQWKYEPARLNGKPVAIHLGLTVKFHLQ